MNAILFIIQFLIITTAICGAVMSDDKWEKVLYTILAVSLSLHFVFWLTSVMYASTLS